MRRQKSTRVRDGRLRAFRIAAFLCLAACILSTVLVSRHPDISAENLAGIPLLLQGNYPQPVAVIEGKARSVKSSGCGAVCMAMAIRYLTDREEDPQDWFLWAYENGYYHGDGLGHEALSAMAKLCHLRSDWVGRGESDRVLRALKSGWPVIAHMDRGTFTRNGHYILLRGVLENGKILVNDPASRKRSSVSYDFSLILDEMKTNTGLLILSI